MVRHEKMVRLSFKPIKKLKCGCFFSKDNILIIECQEHREDSENERPLRGIEK